MLEKAKKIAETLLMSPSEVVLAAADNLNAQYRLLPWAEANKDLVKEAVRELLIRQIIDNMIYVRGGEFTLGDGSDNDNKPVKAVVASFKMAKFTITEGQYMIFGDMDLSKVHSRKPQVNVNWEECVAFAKKLSELTGMKFGLPTEKQWEYAARGGSKSKGYKYAGSDIPEEVAHFNASEIAVVGTKKPNELGIYDMSGNAWEWCRDEYHETYKPARRVELFKKRKPKYNKIVPKVKARR